MSACPSEQTIVDFLDGKLQPKQGGEVHKHIDGCASCRALLAQLAPSINRDTIDGPMVDARIDDRLPPEPTHRTAPMSEIAPADALSVAVVASVLPEVPPDRYDVRDEFARGGLGRIFRAHDKRLARPVAVKQLLAGGTEAARRFIREALITARLQHPAIVPIYEAGRWPSGEPFYSMKLVSGKSLDQVIRSKKTLAERLTLLPTVLAVAEAMAYAHSQRIIHRDLKPANVLVGSFGETVLIDWGLAKDLSTGSEVGSDAMLAPYSDDATEVGTVLGTPTYMPPEQAEGKRVDERADVYALGALLYHMLAGAPPYAGSSSAETLARVLSEPPPPLSAREPGVPADLVTIVEKAMARDPAARYPTAKELAEDLVRFQAGQLVSAHRYSTMEMARRWIQKHQASVIIAVALLAALLSIGALAVTRIAHERDVARRERGEARTAQAQAEKRASELVLAQAQESLDDDPTAAVAWLKQYPPTGDWRAVQAIFADAQSRGVASRVWSFVSRARFLPDGRLLLWGEESAVRVWSTDGKEQTLGAGGARVLRLELSGSGQKMLLLRGDGSVELWDLASGAGKPLAAAPAPNQAAVKGQGVAHTSYERIALSDDGSWAAAAALDGSLDVWHLPDGTRKRLGDGSNAVSALAFGTGTTLASGGDDKRVRLWDVASGTQKLVGKHDAPVGQVLFAPDRKTLLSTDDRSVTRQWELDGSGKSRVYVGRGEQQPAAAFSRDGRMALATGGGAVQLIDLKTGAARKLHGHTSMVKALAFLPDGSQLITVADDHRVLVWDTATLESVTLRGHGAPVETVSIAPDGRHFATGSSDKTVRLWSVPKQTRVLRLPDSELYAVAFAPDGKRLAMGGVGGLLQLCDPVTLVCRALPGHQADVVRLVFAPDGHTLASASADETVRVWDVDSGSSRVFAAEAATSALGFSPDGKRLAYAASPRKLVVAELATGQLRSLETRQMAGWHAEFSPDGRLVATADQSDVLLWDWAANTTRRLTGHTSVVRRVFFSPDGSLLASASNDGTIGLWHVADGSHRFLRGHSNVVNWVSFSGDGTRLASTGFDGTVRVWRASDGQAELVLHGRRVALRRVLFAPDGKLLAAGGDDDTLRLWNATSGDGYVVRGHERPVRDISWSPDGKLVASVGTDGRLQLVRIDELPQQGGHDPRTLKPLLTRATTADIGPEDRPIAGVDDRPTNP